MKRRPDFSGQAVDFELPLYEPKPTDEWYTPQNTPHGGVGEPVNLNAIAYYAMLGMKPKRIGTLVNSTGETIWANGRMRNAYEAGAAYHEIWLRTCTIQQAKFSTNAAFGLLDRVAGQAKDDHESGMSPEEQTASKRVIRFELEDTSNDPEIAALKELLEKRIKAVTGDT